MYIHTHIYNISIPKFSVFCLEKVFDINSFIIKIVLIYFAGDYIIYLLRKCLCCRDRRWV